MATEKKFNTRIILKHDTLANWNSDASLILKEGEVALAKVDTNKQDPISGEIVKVPTYLIKVGDGTSKFSALNWVAAPAADVHDWAKKSESDFTTWVKGLVSVDDIDLSNYYNKNEVNNELAKKVDKVTGKSLVSDSEITRLSGMSDGANKVEASATNGKIKIDGVETTVYTHPDKHAIADVDGLQTALNDKVAKENGKGLSTNDLTDALKGNYDDAYAHSQVTHAPANAQANVIESIKVNGTAQTITDKSVDIAVPTKVSELENDTKYLVASDIANKADKATTLAGYGIGNAYTKTEVDSAIQDAKDYADQHDANTEYHVEYDSAAKKIKLVAGADASKMEIPTDDFIKDGMIQSVAISDDGKNLVITWNTDAGKEATNIPLSELVDVMTGVDGTTVTVNVSADDKISAEVKTNSLTDGHIAANAAIAKGKLATDVQTSLGKADTAIQAADLGDLAAKDNITASLVTDFATEVAKVKVTSANTADSATKATQDGNGKNIASTYATKDEAKYTGNQNISVSDNAISLNSALTGLTSIMGDDTLSLVAQHGVSLGSEFCSLDVARDTVSIKAGDSGAEIEAAQDGMIFMRTKELQITSADGVSINNVALSTIIKETKVDEATKATYDGNGANIASTYAKNADLAAIAKTGNVNDLVQTEGDVLIFDCGDSGVTA